MSQVATRMEQPVAETTRADAMVSMLERVLMDPSVPVERLERLLELQNTERTRQAKVAFAERMSLAQAEMTAVLVDKDNAQTRSKYASYAALDAVVRPIYTKHGFSVTFNTGDAPAEGMIRILAFVECGGFERPYHVDMPCDGKGAKGGDVMTKTHAVKSAVTYGKATLLPMIFNIAVTDKADDDGNGAGRGDSDYTISDEQVEQLRDALRFVGGNEERACRALKVPSLSCILESKFRAALETINAKGQRS